MNTKNITYYLFSSLFPQTSVKVFKKRTFLIVAAIFCFLMILGVGQDLLDASINNYAFYFSESFSFNVFWIVFIPLVSGLIYFSKRVDKKAVSPLHWLLSIIGVVAASIIHIIIVSLVIFVISALLLDHTFHISGIARYFLAEDSAQLLLIYGSAFVFIFYKNSSVSSSKKHHQKVRPKFLSVSVNKKMIPLAPADIQYITTDRPYIAIHTADQKYLHSASLKQILEKLDKRSFLQVHRSAIVNLEYVIHCTSRSNGDYDILMRNGDKLRMSRNFSRQFKKATI